MPVFQTLVWVGAITVKVTVHWLLLPAASVMVMVIRCGPGRTVEPGAGDCEQAGWVVQLSL